MLRWEKNLNRGPPVLTHRPFCRLNQLSGPFVRVGTSTEAHFAPGQAPGTPQWMGALVPALTGGRTKLVAPNHCSFGIVIKRF